MNIALVVLCVAAFALVGVFVSAAAAVALPALDRLAKRLELRDRVRFWIGVAALPALLGLMAVFVSLLPAIGLGQDHCLGHRGDHPHLCPDHLASAPGVLLVSIAAVFALRSLLLFVRVGGELRTARRTSGLLVEASDADGGVRVLPSSEPLAFVLGVFSSRIYVSRGLLGLGESVVEAVIAHERVHARHFDLAWRALCPVLSIGHLPAMAQALSLRLAAAQEMAADAEAADSLQDGRVRLAEAIVLLARASHLPSVGMAFTGGDWKARVHALLEEREVQSAWPGRALVVGALLVPFGALFSHHLIHHALETLLGALS
jgi:Zn-dependent protease with chaperone function